MSSYQVEKQMKESYSMCHHNVCHIMSDHSATASDENLLATNRYHHSECSRLPSIASKVDGIVLMGEGHFDQHRAGVSYFSQSFYHRYRTCYGATNLLN